MASDSAPGAKKETPPVIPHVLHVVDRGVYARFGRMFRQLGIALSDEGIRVSLLTDDVEAAADLDGTPIAERLFKPLRGWGVWRLHGYLRREFDPPPDIVHVWSTTALGFLSEWTLLTETTLLIHTTALDDFAHLSRRGVRDNEILLAACDEYARQLRNRWPGRADAVRVFKPALLFPEKKTECSSIDKTLGILWTGRVDKHSGLEVLIEAAEILHAKSVDIQIGLIGGGPASRHYWREIRRHGVQKYFSLIAEPNLWDQATAGADLFVVPNRQHELALAPLLAMAHEKVVVTSRDQIAEWFIEDETTLQFDPGSAVELAYHITRTADRLPIVRAIARHGAEYVHQNHSITTMAVELARFYHNLKENDGVPTQLDTADSGAEIR